MKKLISSIAVMIITVFIITAGNRTVITGKVSDEQGIGLSGINVNVKNSNRGTISNQTGEYSIPVFETDKILVFSYIGMKTKEMKIGNLNVINVVMEKEMVLHESVAAGHPEQDMDHLSFSTRKLYAPASEYIYTGYITPPDFNTEGYSAIHENGFRNVRDEPLSTFSIDVDRASYSNVRRYINSGHLPPVDAVRVEEMINYFSYDYPEPEGEHPFSVYTELSSCPWSPNHQLLHVGLKGRDMEKSDLPPTNLVFLIDVSGSMNMPNKLPLLKSSMQMLVKELRDKDRVAIVVYAGAAGLVLESIPAGSKNKILDAIDKLQAGGSTAGGQGIKLAYKVAEENLIKGGNNRIILATDGDFNIGVSSNAEMERLVENEREKGIFITVLGFGMGNYKDDKLEIIANKGNGNYTYIDNIQEARKTLITEFAGTLFTIAKDVKFQLEFNPARVKAYRLIGYENRLLNNEDFNDDKKDAGEMGSGHTVTALYEIIPAGSDEIYGNVDPLKYQEKPSPVRTNPHAELLTIKLRYKLPDSKNSIVFEKPVEGILLPLAETSENFRFSAAVAEFGMLLRDSEFKGNADILQILDLARVSRGEDEEGYRNEFLSMVKLTENLKK